MAHGFMVLCFLASYSTAGETPKSAAVEEISAIIRAEVLAMPEWSDADIRVKITDNGSLPAAESFRLAPNGLTITRNNVLAHIEVIRSGKAVQSVWIPAVVHASVPAVVASRKIASGVTITEEDIRESIVETNNISVALTRDPKDIVGKTARRVFAAGVPFPAEAFSEPLLVSRGDMVSLRLERGGISMTSTARALENGRLGEIIRVKSVDFSSEIKARVTGMAEVLIQ